ncbi:hypothetical protein DET53_101806 [Vibrio parahaemolyticus]|nr:hypothetical protein DET53_101806 [Vibrio parahaemolyticus]
MKCMFEKGLICMLSFKYLAARSKRTYAFITDDYIKLQA